MQLPIIAHRGQTKPWGSIPRIDWNHPLARGLVSYGYDVGCGPIDLVTGGQRTIANSTNPPFGGRKVSKYGDSLTSVSAGAGAVTVGLYTLPTSDPIVNIAVAAPYSFAIGYMLTATPTNLTFSQLYSLCDATQNISLGIGIANGGTADLDFNFGPGSSSQNTAALNTLNKFNTAVGVALTATTAACYVNGVLALSPAAITATGAAIAGSKPCFWGRPNKVSQTLSTGYIYYGAMWSQRALTASEALLLHDDPYCFLIYPEDEMFATLATLVPIYAGFSISESSGPSIRRLIGY